MAIKIIYGPGGSGKSFFQLHIIIKQLRETKKNIVTNLAINVAVFNDYLERNFPDESLNLVGRLRILNEDETFEFWKHRGPMKWTGQEYEMTEDRGVNGVCFIIDEAGVSGFSATGWAAKQGAGTRGERCLWYLDQQRKFGDDVFASTNGRTPAQIAKPFRDKAHGFIKLWNGYLAKYGPFKGRGRFEWKEFLEEPGPKSEAIAKGIFELGELANCYRTQDGVGVIGNGADKGARAKGIPILWVVPAALVLALMCVFVPWLLGKGAAGFISGDVEQAVSASKPSPVFDSLRASAGVVSQSTSPGQTKISRQPGESEIPADLTPERPLWVSGYVLRGEKINVQLSDGRILTERDPEIASMERNALHLKSGQRIFLRSVAPARSQTGDAAAAVPVVTPPNSPGV